MKSKYLVVLHFPPSLADRLDALHRLTDPEGARRSRAHLTLVPPFSSDASLLQIRHNIESVLTNYADFYASLGGINTRFPKNDLAVLEVEPSRLLEGLARALTASLHPLMRADGKIRADTLRARKFIPHITMAKSRKGLDPGLCERLDTEFSGEQVHITGVEVWLKEAVAWKRIGVVSF